MSIFRDQTSVILCSQRKLLDLHKKELSAEAEGYPRIIWHEVVILLIILGIFQQSGRISLFSGVWAAKYCNSGKFF